MTTPPLSHDMPCPAGCGHDWHLLPCDINECTCRDVPVPGVYT